MPRRRYNFEVTYAKKKIYIKKKNIAKLIKICTHHTRISSQWLLCIKMSREYIIYPNIIFIRERERERFKFSDHEWQERGKKWNKNTLRTNVSRDILHHSYIRIRPMYVLYIHTYTHRGERDKFHQTSAHAVRRVNLRLHLFNKLFIKP